MPINRRGEYYYVDNPEPVAPPQPAALPITRYSQSAGTSTSATGTGGVTGTPVASGDQFSAPIIVAPRSPEVNYVRALAPTLSYEDAAGYLTTYGGSLGPSGLRGQVNKNRSYFLSSGRAASALESMYKARAEAGQTGDEPGYRFLVNSISLLSQYGGTEGEGMSKDRYRSMMTAFDELLSQAKAANVSSFYTDLAKAFLKPTQASGPVMPATTINGEVHYSAPSRKLYG